jgi:hypothetical protein
MKKRYWCPSCGCVRDFWIAPLIDCRHGVPDDPLYEPTPFVPLPAHHPLAGFDVIATVPA